MSSNGSGLALSFEWPALTPTGGAEILDDVCEFILRFMRMSEAQVIGVALWVAHTYAVEVATWTPYLEVSSAEKRCAKSRLLEVVSYLVRNPWNTSNASAASLFRKIDMEMPTLLFDETDAVFKGDPETAQAIRGILNAGAHCRGMVARCVGQGTNIQTKDFRVFCPKALAGIGRLPETVADRALHIRLRRKPPGEAVERLRERSVEPSAKPLREALSAWIGKQLPALKDATPHLPEALNDRQQDGAEPLLAIADAAGGGWPEKARSALIELYTGAHAADESPRTLLLADCRAIFDQTGSNKISSEELVNALVQIETSPWSEWNRGKPLTKPSLARVLKLFDVRPGTLRSGSEVFKGYHKDSFLEAWKSFLPPVVAEAPSPGFEPLHPLQPNIHAGPEHFPEALQNSDCNGLKNEESPINTRAVTPVTGQKQGEGQKQESRRPGDAEKLEVEL